MRWPAVIVVVVSCAPYGARADSEQDVRLAKRYFQLGAELYQRSDYKAALEQFERAYAHAKLPDLVYNMARCNELLARHAKAIALYQEFVKLSGKKLGTKKDEIAARLATLDKKLRAQQAATREREAKAEKDRMERARLQAEVEQRRRQEAERIAAARRKGPAWPAWTLVGTGGALLSAGVIFGALAAGLSSDVEKHWQGGTPWGDVEDDYTEGETMQTLQIAALVSGGVALTAGAIWLALRHFRKEKSTQSATKITPALLPGGAFISARISF